MDTLPDLTRRRLLVAGAATPIASLLGACAELPGTASGPPAPAPTYKVGDRWVYAGGDGFRDPLVWTETREVIAVAPGAIDIRVTWKGNRVDSTQVERWATPGELVARRGLRHRDALVRPAPAALQVPAHAR
jgi:hypothetical protein